MARYAILDGTEVINLVIWEGPGKRPTRYQHSRWPSRTRPTTTPQPPDPNFRGRAVEVPPGQVVGKGWTYEGGKFVPGPNYTPPSDTILPPEPDE